MKEETTYGHQELINQAIDYIHNHLHQTLSSEMLAMEMNMSVYHFHRLFKSYLQETISAYITRQRMERAVMYLQTRDLSLQEVLLIPTMHVAYIRIIGPHGEESGAIGSLTIENGPYVVYTYRGSYKGLLRTYTHIYSKEKERLRNALSFEEYVTWSKDPSEQITKIYIPIRLNQ